MLTESRTDQTRSRMLWSVIDSLLLLNTLVRDEIPEGSLVSLSPYTRLREFHTVQVATARRAGKTSFLQQAIRVHDVLLTTHRLAEASSWPRGAHNIVVLMGGTAHDEAWARARHVVKSAPSGVFPRVYVDEPRIVFSRPRDLDEMFHRVSGWSCADGMPDVVLLGEPVGGA